MRDGLGRISRVAVIGGSSDIGLAIARELTPLGASRIVLAGRDPESMRARASDLPVEDLVALDLNDDDLRSPVDSIFAGGDVDVVVLAAGVLHDDPSPDQVAEMARVNGSSSVALLALLATALKAQGHGQLIVLSSIAVVRPRPSNYWYGASKVALDFAARGLSDSLQGTGIRVTIVRPGFVHSKMTQGMDKAPFAVRPADVGRAVRQAVQDQTEGVVWVPGALRWVSLLLQWLPLPLLKRMEG